METDLLSSPTLDFSGARTNIPSPFLRRRPDPISPEMTKGATVKAERAKKGLRGSSSSAGTQAGRIQGDWLPPRTTTSRLHELEGQGLLAAGSWRLPKAGEDEPLPRGDEPILLVTHLERGFSLPPHPFFRAFLDFYGAQLHHLPPNVISYLAAFVSLCENFLGCHPHWGLFNDLFTCRMMTVKKATRLGERTSVAQLCEGLGIQLRGKGSFPQMTFPDSVKGWQDSWFYCQDVPVGEGQSGLPP